MQFCQPAFPGYAPNYNPCNPPPFQYNGYPAIIGEGHVTSIMSPDGGIQYLFLPTTHWWKPPYNSNFGNNAQWDNNGAWFIRSAYTPMQQSIYQTMCSPSYQGSYGFQGPLPIASNSCIELHKTDYQMKFHNDGCTSTSDIHYFYPNLRASNWFQVQRACASMQTETHTTNSSCQDQEPCNCPCKHSDGNKTRGKTECMCYSNNFDNITSKMSLGNRSEKCDKKSKNEKRNTKPNDKYMSYSSDSNSCSKKNSKRKNKSNEKRCSFQIAAKRSSREDKTKTKVECMCCSSNSNTSLGKSSRKCKKEKSRKNKTKERGYSFQNKEDKSKEKVVCMCYSSASNSNSSKTSLGKSSEMKKWNKNKKSKGKTQCNDPPQRVDKTFMTFQEQGSNCKEKTGKETQTQSVSDAESMTDLCHVEQARKSSRTFCGDYISCFGSSFCSTSDTESDEGYCPCTSKKNKTK